MGILTRRRITWRVWGLVTSHWTSTGYDAAFTGDFTMPALDLGIPAGATLKRFLIRATSFTWRFRTDTDSEIYPLSLQMEVNVIAGDYMDRQLYRTRRKLADTVVAWRDPVVIRDTYVWWGNSGDNELGVNHELSYGKADGIGFTMRLSTNVINRGPTPAFPVGRGILQFSALYLAP